jgi:hypothetical protein
VVTSRQPGHVVIVWRRNSPTWDRSELGLWVSQWASTGAPNSWSFSTPVHWAQSAYDLPAAAFRDDRGHLYVTYQVVPDDVRE